MCSIFFRMQEWIVFKNLPFLRGVFHLIIIFKNYGFLWLGMDNYWKILDVTNSFLVVVDNYS